MWTSSSTRAGLVRSATSRLIQAWAGAGRAAALGATATTFSAAGRAAGGSAVGAAEGATDVVAGLGVAKAPVMRWNRFGDRLSAADRAATGRATGSLVRTGGLARLTRQSFSSTSGRCDAATGAAAGGAATGRGGTPDTWARGGAAGAAA